MGIDFLICNYNGGALLKKCVNSIVALNLDNYHIYVYDNASTDNSINELKKVNNDSNLTIVLDKDNIGYGKAINKLYALSKKEFIFILNPDAELTFNVTELLDLIHESPNNKIFGFNIFNNDGTIQNFIASEPSFKWIIGGLLRSGFPFLMNPFYKFYFKIMKTENKQKKTSSFVSGCALLMSRKIFDKIGKFNEQYFLYFEDTELLYTSNKIGYEIVRSNLGVKHNASYSFKKASNTIKVEKFRSALIYFRNIKGYLSFVMLKFILFSLAILCLLNPLNLFNRNTNDYYMKLIQISLQ